MSRVRERGDNKSTLGAMTFQLELDGKSTTGVPLPWRKRLLRNAIDFNDPLRYTTHRAEDRIAAFRAACDRGDE
jgi:ATP-dependent DNA ligase